MQAKDHSNPIFQLLIANHPIPRYLLNADDQNQTNQLVRIFEPSTHETCIPPTLDFIFLHNSSALINDRCPLSLKTYGSPSSTPVYSRVSPSLVSHCPSNRGKPCRLQGFSPGFCVLVDLQNLFPRTTWVRIQPRSWTLPDSSRGVGPSVDGRIFCAATLQMAEVGDVGELFSLKKILMEKTLCSISRIPWKKKKWSVVPRKYRIRFGASS